MFFHQSYINKFKSKYFMFSINYLPVSSPLEYPLYQSRSINIVNPYIYDIKIHIENILRRKYLR